MFFRLAIVLAALWVVGSSLPYTAGNKFIPVLLSLAIVAATIHVIIASGRRRNA